MNMHVAKSEFIDIRPQADADGGLPVAPLAMPKQELEARVRPLTALVQWFTLAALSRREQ